MTKKVALITGITGQDGSYLAEFLLEKVMRFMGLSVDLHYLIPNVLITFTKIHILPTQNSISITET